jgi:hypothetical protein
MENLKRTRLFATIFVGIVAASCLTQMALAQPSNYKFTKIADLKDYGGYTYGYFEPAAINDRRDVLFAPLVGYILDQDLNEVGWEAVVLWRQGNLTTIAAGKLNGDPFFNTLSPVAMNDSGTLAYTLAKDAANSSSSVYRYDARTGQNIVMWPHYIANGIELLGSLWGTAINNQNTIAFNGQICTSITGYPGNACQSNGTLSYGVFKADARGTVTPFVIPGDLAPGGKPFDVAHAPSMNSSGDVVFAAHVQGDSCVMVGVYCYDSVFVKRTPSGRVEQVARIQTMSPTGVAFNAAWGGVINDSGDVAFVADVSPEGDFSQIGIFLYSHGIVTTIAKYGDNMPGGGKFETGGGWPHGVAINNSGTIAFGAKLQNGAGNGIYLWRNGKVQDVVVKTGTNTGVGTVANVQDLVYNVPDTNFLLAMNNSGDIIFTARFTDLTGALLMASPK